jgi:hypothetical protein
MRKVFLLFLLYNCLHILIILLSNYFLYTDELVVEFLLQKFPYKDAEDFSSSYKSSQWVFIIIIPIFLFIKCSLIANCFITGSILYNYRFNFKDYFRITLVGEYIFLLPMLIKIIWFMFIQVDFDYYDLKNFITFSTYDLFPNNSLEFWFAYPLKLMNVFEIIYMIILTRQIASYLNLTFARSLMFMLSTYFVGLLLWILLISFVVLSIS